MNYTFLLEEKLIFSSSRSLDFLEPSISLPFYFNIALDHKVKKNTFCKDYPIGFFRRTDDVFHCLALTKISMLKEIQALIAQ